MGTDPHASSNRAPTPRIGESCGICLQPWTVDHDCHTTRNREANFGDFAKFGIYVSDQAEADIAAYLEREPYPDAANIREIVRSVAIREADRYCPTCEGECRDP